MNSTRLFVIAACAALAPALAPAQEHPLREHPAVIIKRQSETPQGYDYASKYYPHPAWLYLSAEPPRPMSDHPAVVVHRRYEQEMRARIAVTAPVEQGDKGR